MATEIITGNIIVGYLTNNGLKATSQRNVLTNEADGSVGICRVRSPYIPISLRRKFLFVPYSRQIGTLQYGLDTDADGLAVGHTDIHPDHKWKMFKQKNCSERDIKVLTDIVSDLTSRFEVEIDLI